tara:strand:- start:51 stop:428 length:378 start_codon:yes stop_codon:yes gene_type:complete
MENLIDNISFLEKNFLLKGFIFGSIHICIMILGFYTGISINRFLKLISNGFIAGIAGVVVAHAVSALIAAMLDPELREAAAGIFLGGLLPLPFLPLLEKYIVKSKHHIVFGDHEDLKKDLKKKHK